MGKLLFVNTNRVNGIASLFICAVLITFGVWAVVDGAYYGILLALLGLAGIKFFLRMATQKTELYEQGFLSKDMFDSVRGRYADLKGINRTAVSVNGVLNTTIFLATNSGKKVIVRNEKLLKGDDKMELLLQCAAHELSEVWAKKLESQTEVVWLMNGADPQVKIRKEGVLVNTKAGTETYIPFGELEIKPGFALLIQLFRGTEKVLTVSSDTNNYFVGRVLIAKLMDKQKLSMAAGRI